jgi:hypothetical protein
MSGLSSERTQKVLVKHLPRSLVSNFMSGKERGFLRAQKIDNVQDEMLKAGIVDFIGKEKEALQWATSLHDIAYINDRVQYKQVFASHEVSKESIFPVLARLDNLSAAKVLNEVGEFNAALKSKEAPLYPFHHLTGALFAYNILRKERQLSEIDAVIAAQAIMFHHERNLELIPYVPAVRLLRDAIKLESLTVENLANNIERNIHEYDRPFFDPGIIQEVREEIIEGHITPEDQEFANEGFRLDAFQFAVRSLFPDTNPDMYSLSGMAREYLRGNGIFINLLKIVVDAALTNNENPELQIDNLRTLKELMKFTMKHDKYSSNIKFIQTGLGIINVNLSHVLEVIEHSLKFRFPEKNYSLASLLSLKAKALEALEKMGESNVVKLRAGIESIMEKDKQAGN